MPTQLDPAIIGTLRCFEAAGRLLSFTKAATALSLTQSAVSQQIRQLEQRLGYPLFVRHPRGLALTPKGAVLHEVTASAFSDLNRTLTKLEKPDVALLNVSCLPSFALQWLMPRLADFHRQHPDISVRLKAEVDTVARHKFQGGIDVAIRYLPPDDIPDDGVALFDEFLIAAATPDYLRHHPPAIEKAWFESVTLLRDVEPWESAPEDIEWQTWLHDVMPTPVGLADGSHFNFNLSSLAISAALNHQGVLIGRTALICEELRTGRLVNVFGRLVPAPARYVVLRQARSGSHVCAFVDWLVGACANFDRERRLQFEKPL
ncbi:LysR family transcriptional regulator [Burkholderia ubonensis]|uniref:LysR substrate-binding domain-containing protein n=1 Tax=Burkholderia ubonensis TaxID=101571 RepID=UPI00075DFFFA|nr:LysR substrate-binding domain-containing protein [Burkholderia ubonensis]KVO44157.1 LysR family transcriptional regulator [Burkholderia ubonensis]KVP34525.1 LysR family transcriptional regulator [Burkholderia ubonensis]